MKRLKMYWMIDCYAFTIVCLVNALLVVFGLSEDTLSIVNVIPIFMATTLVALLMYLTDIICKENNIIRHVFRLVDIMISVNLFEILFYQVQIDIKKIVINAIMCLIFYVIVYLMMVVSWREQDQKTNESLEKIRARKRNK